MLVSILAKKALQVSDLLLRKVAEGLERQVEKGKLLKDKNGNEDGYSRRKHP